MTDELKQVLRLKGYEGEYDLASLINGCGSGQFSLSRIPEAFSGWKAIAENGDVKATALNPEEAVAKLIVLLKTPKPVQAEEIIV